jgi:hypothetical protein
MTEKALATKIERDIPSESLSTGQVGHVEDHSTGRAAAAHRVQADDAGAYSAARSPEDTQQEAVREKVSVSAAGAGRERGQVPSMGPVPARDAVADPDVTGNGQHRRGAHRASGPAE